MVMLMLKASKMLWHTNPQGLLFDTQLAMEII